MNWLGALIIYVLVWWCVFFAVLPTGVRGRWEDVSDGVEGAEPGAPSDPQMKKKLIRTSWIAAVIWAVLCALILSGVFDFRDR